MVLTTPVGGALDKILEKLRDSDPETRHRDIGDLFAKQGLFADLDLGPDQRRFVYIPTAQGPDVVPVHVSMRDDKPRALWVVASYATRAEGSRVHALRRDGEHRHVHHLQIGRGFIDWDKRPGTDS